MSSLLREWDPRGVAVVPFFFVGGGGGGGFGVEGFASSNVGVQEASRRFRSHITLPACRVLARIIFSSLRCFLSLVESSKKYARLRPRRC